jgi:hypothetical protein
VWCGPETYKSDIRADDIEDREPAVGMPALLLRPASPTL